MSPKARVEPAAGRARDAGRRAARRERRFPVIGTASILVLLAVVAGALLLGRGTPQPVDGSVTAGSAEPGVSIDPGRIEVGKVFPGFSVTDVDGRVVTRDSLAGTPTIIWFTTSYCLPCQAGAVQVARLDDQLGGSALNVLVMFVDPGEGAQALTSWRDRFGNPDWMVALDRDGTLANAVGLRFLDTKLLLGPDGSLRDVNTAPVDPAYLTLLRGAVRGSA